MRAPYKARASTPALAILATAMLLLAPRAAAATAAVRVFPIPGSRLATPQTQISFRGIAPGRVGTISVIGTSTGVHTGHLSADSDGKGASFYPDQPFAAGEAVTVRTSLPVTGGQLGAFRFTIERPAPPLLPTFHSPAPRVRGDVSSFRSRPDLKPDTVRIKRSYSGVADVFLAPMRGPLQWGPMIFDRWGHLVWFLPRADPYTVVTDFKVQRYLGQPVLTWWQGFISNVGVGEDFIYDRHYKEIARVRAGNGLAADLHEFNITPEGTALITAYRPVYWDGSAVGAGGNQDVLDAVVQEIDIRTGNVLFQWDSLDHVPLRDSYVPVPSPSAGAYDYFHANSVTRDSDGNLIISARNTWAVYKVNHATGAVMWTLGGKHSSLTMGPGTRTAYQHDAVPHRGGLLTIFDNGAAPPVHRQSRVLLERVNTRRRTVTLIRAIHHAPRVVASVEGSAQLLSSGRVFVGWGAGGPFSEYDRTGRQLYDGRLVSSQSSYRSYDFAWSGQPDTAPAVAIRRGSAGVRTVFVSWNGATEVSSWRVLAGSGNTSLKRVAVARRHGFETAIKVRTSRPELAVQGISASGRVLGQSRVVSARR